MKSIQNSQNFSETNGLIRKDIKTFYQQKNYCFVQRTISEIPQ